MQRLLFAAAIALAIGCGPVRAASTDIGETTWYAVNDACGIDAIDFYSDGTADIYDLVSDDSDTARWHLDGTTLTIEYDSWYGGIEGTVFDGQRIEGTETWQDADTLETHHDPCIFEIDQPDESPSPGGDHA
jgi:hypothetical protein